MNISFDLQNAFCCVIRKLWNYSQTLKNWKNFLCQFWIKIICLDCIMSCTHLLLGSTSWSLTHGDWFNDKKTIPCQSCLGLSIKLSKIFCHWLRTCAYFWPHSLFQKNPHHLLVCQTSCQTLQVTRDVPFVIQHCKMNRAFPLGLRLRFTGKRS